MKFFQCLLTILHCKRLGQFKSLNIFSAKWGNLRITSSILDGNSDTDQQLKLQINKLLWCRKNTSILVDLNISKIFTERGYQCKKTLMYIIIDIYICNELNYLNFQASIFLNICLKICSTTQFNLHVHWLRSPPGILNWIFLSKCNLNNCFALALLRHQ